MVDQTIVEKIAKNYEYVELGAMQTLKILHISNNAAETLILITFTHLQKSASMKPRVITPNVLFAYLLVTRLRDANTLKMSLFTGLTHNARVDRRRGMFSRFCLMFRALKTFAIRRVLKTTQNRNISAYKREYLSCKIMQNLRMLKLVLLSGCRTVLLKGGRWEKGRNGASCQMHPKIC